MKNYRRGTSHHSKVLFRQFALSLFTSFWCVTTRKLLSKYSTYKILECYLATKQFSSILSPEALQFTSQTVKKSPTIVRNLYVVAYG